MPYVKLEGIKHFNPSVIEHFKNDLIIHYAKALGEPENRIWLKVDPDGYWNHIKQREIVIITVFDYKDDKVFNEVVKETANLIKKYELEFSIDVHLLESRLYHSFFSKQTLLEKYRILGKHTL